MIAGLETAQARGLGRPVVGAMLLVTCGMITMMLTSDMKDSVLFARLDRGGPAQEGRPQVPLRGR